MNNQYSENESSDSSKRPPADAADKTNLPHAGILGPDGKSIPGAQKAEASQETYRKIADAEKRISKWVVIWAGVTALATVTQVGIAWYGNYNTGKTQTDQFNQMKSVADRMEGAAKSFAGNSANINEGISDAVSKLNLQAEASKELAKQAHAQSRIAQQAVITAQHSLFVTTHSQRAWIGLKDFHIVEFAPNRPIKIEIDFANTGQTPALEVKSGIMPIWLKPTRSDASKTQEIRKARQIIDLTPNEAVAPSQQINLAYSTASAKVESGITGFAYSDVVSGANSLYFPGRIEYKDVFDRPQWVEFCVYIYGTGSGGIGISGCPVEESHMSYQREDQ